MSIMFRKALSNHIDQLTKRLEQAPSPDAERELAQINQLLVVARDGRFRRSLETQKKRLQAQKTSPMDGTDVRKRLDALRAVYVQLKDHPEYQAGRRGRKPRVRA